MEGAVIFSWNESLLKVYYNQFIKNYRGHLHTHSSGSETKVWLQ